MKKSLIYLNLLFIFCVFSFSTALAEKKAKKLRLIVATMAPEGSPWETGVSDYIKNFTKYSKDTVKIKYFSGGVLGDEFSVVKKVKKNKVQVTAVSLGALAALVPEMAVIELPFLFMSQKEVDKVMGKIAKNEMSKVLEKYGFIFLTTQDVGWRSMGTCKKEIKKVEDLKGLKMRSQESKVHMDMWKAIGVSPLPINITETMSALQTGIVDGLDNSPMWFMTTSWYHNIKFLLKTEHIYQPGFFVSNMEYYNSLSPELKKALVDATIGIPEKVTSMVRTFEKNVFDIFKKSGIKISDISPAERLKMKKLTSSVHKTFLKGTTADGKKIYNSIKKILK